MTHPHAHLLGEVEIAIKKLSPTLTDLSKEAQSKLKAMEADENINEEAIISFLSEVGRKEYPHRHALTDIHKTYGEGVEVSMILEHVDADVKKKLQPMMKDGVTVDELISSNWFEKELNPEQRYQVEDGTLLARYKVEQEDKGLVASHRDEFDKLVAKYEGEAKKIEALLEELNSLADKDARYKDEIENQVSTFREGWSVVERDPNPEEINGAIQYWKDVFGGEEE